MNADRNMQINGNGKNATPRPTPHQIETPLPWDWFEFRTNGTPISPTTLFPDISQSGATRDYQLQIDGWQIPFKVLRMPATSPRPWLMLMHGMGLGIATFRGIAPYLLQTHDLILPDYAGFSVDGGRGGRLGCAGFKTYIQGMWRIADAVGANSLSLGGNSLGGGLCLMAALLNPRRVEKLLFSNPACYPQELPRTYRLARVPIVGEVLMSLTPGKDFIGGVEYIGYVDKEKFDPALKGRYIDSLNVWENKMRLMAIIRCLPNDARDLTAVAHLARLPELTMPVLLSWGGMDPLLVEGSGERMAADLPNITFERYGDLAHMPHEEDPQRIGTRWSAFLNERH